MSKSGRSLRFNSVDDMPPGMQVLARRAEEQAKNDQVSRLVATLAGARAEPEQGIAVPGALLGLPKAAKRANKFGAVATYVDGIRFDSKREARYYETLKARRAAGEIRYFLRQVPLHLPGGTKLVVDFQVVEADGRIRYVDTKGRETATFRLKKREVEHHYPVEIELA